MSINKPPPEATFAEALEDRLQVAVRAFILFSQGLFRARQPGSYHWDPVDEESDVFIAGQEPDEREASNKRPRIIVSRTQVNFGGTSIDQTLTPRWIGQNLTMTDLVNFHIVFSCTAREGLEAQLLGWWIATRMLLFQRELHKVGRLHHIATQRLTINPETPAKRVIPGSPTPEWKTVQVSVPVSLQEVISADASGFYSQVSRYMLEFNDS